MTTGAPAGGSPPARREPPASVHTGLLRIREELPAWQAWLLGLVPVALLLLAWVFVTSGAAEERVISPTILPSPAEVVASFPLLWFDRALTRNLAVSFVRVVEGFVLALVVSFPLGLLMGSFTKVKAAFTPLTIFGAYLPIPTLVPLTLSLFGTAELQKVMFLALAFSIYLVPLFVAAVDAVDDTYLKTAYTLGATKGQAVSRVLLPISWPEIWQAMRMGFGVGWSYILLAEMVDVGRGIGGIIITSQRRGPPRAHLPGAGDHRGGGLPDRQAVGRGRAVALPLPGGEAMSTLPPVIEFKGVTKTFNPGAPTQFTALKDVSFRIDDIPNYGEFIAIVGPLGLRQVHDPEPHPRLLGRLPADHGRGARARAEGGGPGARPRDDLPEVQLVPAPHGARERDLRPRAERGRAEARPAPTARPAPASGSRRSASAATRRSTRTSSRAGSSSGWRSRARSSSSRRSS